MGRIEVDAHLIKRSIRSISFTTPFYFRKGHRRQAPTEAFWVGTALAGFYPNADGGAGLQGAGGFELEAIGAVIKRLGINAILLVEYGKGDGARVGMTFGCSFFGSQTHFFSYYLGHPI